MPSADQVPTKLSHSTMLWHEWVVLIAGSTGSALRAVRPTSDDNTSDVQSRHYHLSRPPLSMFRSPLSIFSLVWTPPGSPLLPYPTLFRSGAAMCPAF